MLLPLTATPQHHQFSSPPISTTSQPSPQPPAAAAISLLRRCRTLDELSQVHALLVKTALIHQPHVFGRLLLSASSTPGPAAALGYSRKLFDNSSLPRDAFVYNSMLRALSRRGDPREALDLYFRMVCDGVAPDGFTYTFVLNSCAGTLSVGEGRQVHARMVKCRDGVGTHSLNALMDLYVKIGGAGDVVRRIFREISDPDVVSWNCLLSAYVQAGELGIARELFDDMVDRDTVSWTTILVGYLNAGMLEEACHLFDAMPERNTVAWTAMINGYVQLGCYKEALVLFNEMQAMDVEIDKITLTTLLSACANLGALDQGRWIHTFIDKHSIDVDAHLSTALIDMYAKCGRIDLSLDIFRGSRHRKVFVWNAILGGLAMHSRGREAIELYSKMLQTGTKPNEITYICVLSACSHSGFVEEGQQIFYSMVRDHNVAPTIEHYGCLVDLLGRAGLLNDAKWVVETMPLEPDGNIWRALLAACRVHGAIKLGEEVGRIMIETEPMDDGTYVLLSNILATGNKWEEVSKMRRKMKERGVRKVPGCSSIELDGVVHTFSSGDSSHPHNQEISVVLDDTSRRLYEIDAET